MITVTKKNEASLNVECDVSVAQEINDFFTFDFNVQGALVGDVYSISDPATSTSVSHTVVFGDTIQTITTSLFNQIVALKNLQTEPWLWFDWSQVTNDIGPCIRAYGNDVNRFVAEVQLATAGTGGQFTDIQLPGETLFTWDGLKYANMAEIEWTIFKDETDISPAYYFNIRGAIGTYNSLPVTDYR